MLVTLVHIALACSLLNSTLLILILAMVSANNAKKRYAAQQDFIEIMKHLRALDRHLEVFDNIDRS